MLLEELHWEGPGTIEELDTWGIEPILGQLRQFDEYIQPCHGDEDPQLVYFYYDLRNKVERLQKTIFRLFAEMLGEQEKPIDTALDIVRNHTSVGEKYILNDILRVHLKDTERPPEQEAHDAVEAE